MNLSTALRRPSAGLWSMFRPKASSTSSRPVGGKAYDSDGLDHTLRDHYDIEMIAPNRRNRSRSQDGRKLRRYRKGWKVERLFAWIALIT